METGAERPDAGSPRRGGCKVGRCVRGWEVGHPTRRRWLYLTATYKSGRQCRSGRSRSVPPVEYAGRTLLKQNRGTSARRRTAAAGHTLHRPLRRTGCASLAGIGGPEATSRALAALARSPSTRRGSHGPCLHYVSASVGPGQQRGPPCGCFHSVLSHSTLIGGLGLSVGGGADSKTSIGQSNVYDV